MSKLYSVCVKISVVRLERDLRAGPVDSPMAASGALRHAAVVLLEPDLALALDLESQRFGDGVHGAHADAVQTGAHLVARVIELAAGVEHGHHDLGGADAALGHDADRNAAPVVLDGDRAVEVDGHVDVRGSGRRGARPRRCPRPPTPGGGARSRRARRRCTCRAASHGLEPLEHGDISGVVVARGSGCFGGLNHDVSRTVAIATDEPHGKAETSL